MKEILISKEYENQRADKFIKKYLNDAPLSFIYKTFRKKDIKINGHWIKENYILKENDLLTIYVNDETLKEFNNPKKIEGVNYSDLDIVYEDNNILIVNKNKGLLVHGDESEKRITLTNKVQSYLYSIGEFKNDGKSFIPSPVHRLDRNTGGLVIFAKNLKSSQELTEIFKERTKIDKYYIALVSGKTKEEGEINIPLKKDANKGLVYKCSIKDGGKEAITQFCKIGGNNKYSLLKIKLITGKTHQIRVHFKEIGHPLIGDGKYGDFEINRYFSKAFHYGNQFLISYKIEFLSLVGELSYLSNKKFICDLPKEEKDILNQLKIKYKLD